MLTKFDTIDDRVKKIGDACKMCVAKKKICFNFR